MDLFGLTAAFLDGNTREMRKNTPFRRSVAVASTVARMQDSRSMALSGQYNSDIDRLGQYLCVVTSNPHLLSSGQKPSKSFARTVSSRTDGIRKHTQGPKEDGIFGNGDE